MQYCGLGIQYDQMTISNFWKIGDTSLLCSTKQMKYFISDISVIIVHADWGEHDGQMNSLL